MRGLLLVLLTALAVAGCGPRALEARRLLEDVAAGTGPSELKDATPVPERRSTSWVVDGRAGSGDLYLPVGRPAARLVLVPGLTPAGKDDPRLIDFAHSLARVRFAVLVPDIASVRELRVTAADARAIADAGRHLLAVEAPPAGAPDAVGLAAISYAVGPTVMAALEPDLRDRVGFVLAVGGYYDLSAVVTFITTGYYRTGPDEAWQAGRPSSLAVWHFAAVNATELDDPADREALVAIAARRRADRRAPIDDLRNRLGPEGSAVLALIENRDPDRAAALIAALPARLRQSMDALSLATKDLTELQARLLLVHGRSDPVIPATESRRLAAAAGSDRAELFLVGGLDHANLTGWMGVSDQLLLWQAGQLLLAERDRLAR